LTRRHYFMQFDPEREFIKGVLIAIAVAVIICALAK
jgi:hypothetical protein